MRSSAAARGASEPAEPGLLRLALPRPAIAAVIAFGAMGLLLAAVLLLALTRLASGAGRLVHEGEAVAELIDSGRATAADGTAAAERAEAGVTATADAADQAAGFVSELAAALRETAASLRVDVFGSRPFAAAADRVDHAADQADQAATGLRTAASRAREGAAQLHSVSTDLDRIAASMAGIGGGLPAGNGVDDASLAVLEAALVGLLIWLAIPAAVCLWLGIRLWRRPEPRPRPGARQEPVR